MKKSFCLTALLLFVLAIPSLISAGEAADAYRRQNGLLPYDPPEWFLEGAFVAREYNPVFVFGKVREFVQTLGASTTWLIEDLELKRLERNAKSPKKLEYTLFLEAVSAERTDYWVFVVLPHESAQAWFDARRAFHGRKANDYYGSTKKELESALNQGLKLTAELRFLIEKGETSLAVPEDLIMDRLKIRPVFNLKNGAWLKQDAKTDVR